MASSSPIPAALKVLDQIPISPPVGSVPETTIPLSFSDLMWLYMGAVERLFFYSLPSITTSSHFIEHLLPSLKSSLSLTLRHFFPLAGHIIFSPNPNPTFHYRYSNTDSISFTVAESDDDFKHLTGDDARSVLRLKPLVPSLSSVSADATPLMAVQVTVFPNQGVCIGVTINHGACDGASTANFFKSWADTCKSGTISTGTITPLFDRSLFVYPKELDSMYLNIAVKFRELLLSKRLTSSSSSSSSSTDHEVNKDDVVIASFWLTRHQIEKLKQWISKEKVAVHCSTFVVVCAYVWTCQVRAREWETNRIAWFGFPVNLRGRQRPPVPEEYFGNCLGICSASAEVGELVKEDGVRVAAEVVRRAIDELRDGALRYASTWPEIGRNLGDKKPLTVAGSPAFRVYDMDFGWGRPVKVEVVSLGRNGAMSLSEGRDGEGIGIGLSASKHEMDKFRFEFAKCLQVLESLS